MTVTASPSRWADTSVGKYAGASIRTPKRTYDSYKNLIVHTNIIYNVQTHSGNYISVGYLAMPVCYAPDKLI